MNDQFVDATEHVLARWRAEEDALWARLAAEVGRLAADVAMPTLPPRRRHLGR
jgi:hypothetical protein